MAERYMAITQETGPLTEGKFHTVLVKSTLTEQHPSMQKITALPERNDEPDAHLTAMYWG